MPSANSISSASECLCIIHAHREKIIGLYLMFDGKVRRLGLGQHSKDLGPAEVAAARSDFAPLNCKTAH